MIIATFLVLLHAIIALADHPHPPPKPPPKPPSLAETTTLLSASVELAPIPFTQKTSPSAFSHSLALHDQLAVIGDPSSSSFVIQQLVEGSNWQEVVVVNVTSLASNASMAEDYEAGQAVALSSNMILTTKVTKQWVYTADCPEVMCQESPYDTCCPHLNTTDVLSIMLYSYDRSMNVELLQELPVDFSSTISDDMESDILSISVTDVHVHLSSWDEFVVAVSWVLTNTSVSLNEDTADLHEYTSYSGHSQNFIGTLNLYDNDEVASWNTVPEVMHHQSDSFTSRDSVSDMLTAIAFQNYQVVQGFCNNSDVAPSAGVVYYYVFVPDKIEDEASEIQYAQWFLQQALYPTSMDDSNFGEDFTEAHFGSAVALQSDTLAIGAYGLDCVYMYSFNQSTWELFTILAASDGSAGELFGFSLQLLNSNQIVIGSPLSYNSNGKQSGAVFNYGYFSDLDTWMELSKAEIVNASDGKCFGSSVAAVEEHLYIVSAFPTAVIKRVGGQFVSNSSNFSAAVYSMDFADCESYTTCTDEFYNATSNETTPEICTSYSTCDSTRSSSGNDNDSYMLIYVVVIVGSILIILPLLVLGVVMVRYRIVANRGEHMDDSTDSQGAPVLRMTPLHSVEDGGASGSVGESPVGRPPLAAGGQKKGRGNKSYSALTSQAQVEPVSPANNQSTSQTDQATTTVGGLLNKLRYNLGGSSTGSVDEKETSTSMLHQKQQVDLNDINSPSGPPRNPLPKNTTVNKSPFATASVEV